MIQYLSKSLCKYHSPSLARSSLTDGCRSPFSGSQPLRQSLVDKSTRTESRSCRSHEVLGTCNRNDKPATDPAKGKHIAFSAAPLVSLVHLYVSALCLFFPCETDVPHLRQPSTTRCGAFLQAMTKPPCSGLSCPDGESGICTKSRPCQSPRYWCWIHLMEKVLRWRAV